MPNLWDYDLNDWRLSGKYIQSGSNRVTLEKHYPVAGQIGLLEVMSYSNDTERIMQRYTLFNTSDVYIRWREWDGTWNAWIKQPTRTEIDSLDQRVSALEN